jgi:hypothetical protein
MQSYLSTTQGTDGLQTLCHHWFLGALCGLLHNFPYYATQGTELPPLPHVSVGWRRGHEPLYTEMHSSYTILALKMEACTSKTLATSTISTHSNNPRTELTSTVKAVKALTTHKHATLDSIDTTAYVLFPQKPQTQHTYNFNTSILLAAHSPLNSNTTLS